MKIQRILYPTDFSEHTKVAERFACELADQDGAELHVLHVLNDLTMMMPETATSLMVPPEIIADVIRSAEETITQIPDAAWSQGKKVVRKVRIGPVAHEITNYAKENDIDLIVIGTHGRTGMKHLLLGSVAEKVVRHASCPVLTVRPKN